jgi:hypothetical protein
MVEQNSSPCNSQGTERKKMPVLTRMLVILVTQKAEIRRIMVQSQPGQIVLETLFQKKKPHHKKSLVEWLKE